MSDGFEGELVKSIAVLHQQSKIKNRERLAV